MKNHLDLGCGTNPQNPYHMPNVFGIDIRDDAQELLAGRGITMKKANLVTEPIPFEDNFFASISAIDFIEHIPRQICLGSSNQLVYPFINLMNEIWRVLAPGGKFLAVTPAFPSPSAFADPTHVNYIADSTHMYFCGERPAGQMYGFRGKFIARIAKCSAQTNYRNMPHSPVKSAIRDMGRRLTGKGLSHIIWELEAVK